MCTVYTFLTSESVCFDCYLKLLPWHSMDFNRHFKVFWLGGFKESTLVGRQNDLLVVVNALKKKRMLKAELVYGCKTIH